MEFEIEQDEPAGILGTVFKEPACRHDKRKRAYFEREDASWLWVCLSPGCGLKGDDHALPPGWKKSGHGFLFDIAQLEIRRGGAQRHQHGRRCQRHGEAPWESFER